MVTVRVDDHEAEYSDGDIQYVSDEEVTLVFERGDRWNLRMTYEPYVHDAKILSFTVQTDECGTYGHIHHLDIPSGLRGFRFGRLCLAIFYAVLRDDAIHQFSMKFGGGEDSRGFLEGLGFDKSDVYAPQDSEFSGESVMVGEFVSTGTRPEEWRLYPISVANFPRAFFDRQ